MCDQWASLCQQHKKQFISFQGGQFLSFFSTQYTRQKRVCHTIYGNSFWLHLNCRQSVLLGLCSPPPGNCQPGAQASDALRPSFLLSYWYLNAPAIIKRFISEPNNYLQGYAVRARKLVYTSRSYENEKERERESKKSLKSVLLLHWCLEA